MLEIQKYLMSGKSLVQLKDELGIEYNEYGNLIILNYSQIDSPKTHPIVLECRGLVLEKDTWQLISYPLRRFFNYEESLEITQSFDYSVATALEKIDGSFISYFNYKDTWLMASRSVIENDSKVGITNISFKDLFYKTLNLYPNFYKVIDKRFCYYLELTSLENRVVTVYNKPELHLLMMRDTKTWKELNLTELKQYSSILGIELPNIQQFSNKDNLVELSKKLATLQEGFVAVDYSKHDTDNLSYARVKVKNPSYVAIHHLKDNIARSMRSIVSLVYDGDCDEFLSYFPEFTNYVNDIKIKYENYLNDLNNDFILAKEKLKEDKKTFALYFKNNKNSMFLFNLYNGKIQSVKDGLNLIEKTKSRKGLENFLVEKLNLKNMEFNA